MHIRSVPHLPCLLHAIPRKSVGCLGMPSMPEPPVHRRSNPMSKAQMSVSSELCKPEALAGRILRRNMPTLPGAGHTAASPQTLADGAGTVMAQHAGRDSLPTSVRDRRRRCRRRCSCRCRIPIVFERDKCRKWLCGLS